MATSLTPVEQLSAAQAQYKNWYNQQVASGNNFTLADINAQKAITKKYEFVYLEPLDEIKTKPSYNNQINKRDNRTRNNLFW